MKLSHYPAPSPSERRACETGLGFDRGEPSRIRCRISDPLSATIGRVIDTRRQRSARPMRGKRRKARAMALPVLETGRLTLRPLQEADAEERHAAHGDAEAMRFWEFPASSDVEETAPKQRRERHGEYHGAVRGQSRQEPR